MLGPQDPGPAPADGAPKGEHDREIPISSDVRSMSEAAWAMLHERNSPPTLFLSKGTVVEVFPKRRDQPVVPLLPPRLRHLLRRAGSWTKAQTSGGSKVGDTPKDVCEDMLQDANPPLPALTGILRVPSFLADGRRLVTPGYDPASGYYLLPNPGIQLGPIPDSPTNEELAASRDLLWSELLVDFPFVSDADRAHAVGLMILPFVRPMIDGPTPLMVITKPTPGSGGTLLARTILAPALGGEVGLMAEGRGEEEWRKRLTSSLRRQPTAILIDNAKTRLDSAALSSALTTPLWEDRLMGFSENVLVPVTCAWVVTGNSVQLSNEMSRRSVPIQLDPKRERPWERTGFRHELPRWALEQRGRLITAILTLAQGWISRGRPAPSRQLGGFESWSYVVGGILACCGIPWFLENVSAFQGDRDEEGDAWRRLVEAWHEKFQGSPVRTSDLLPIAIAVGLVDGDVAKHGSSVAFGKDLRRAVGRRVGSWTIREAGSSHGAKLYRLTQADPHPPPTPTSTHQPKSP